MYTAFILQNLAVFVKHKLTAFSQNIFRGENMEKEKREEKQPIGWEAVDPKPPVIRSGHLENRKVN